PLGHRLAAFYAGAGIEIFEGYGLTETTAAATLTPPLKPRIGTVGRPLPGTAVRIADDGEVLLRGAQVFTGYWDAATGGPLRNGDGFGDGRGQGLPAYEEHGYGESDGGWLATGDIGALDADGYLTITGRKKELIVTSGGKNVAPAPLEDRLRAHPLVGQCIFLGDDRPYITALITLEADGLAHWRMMKKKQRVPMAELVTDEVLLADIQDAVDDANKLVSRAESIRRFTVLPVDFTEEAGHLTPSLKLRRAAIARDFAEEIEELYVRGGSEAPGP
ncbi:AMP-binding protein, partial [Streptomyces rimosus]